MPSQASPRQAASGAGATDPLLLWKTGFNILVVVSGSRAFDKPWVAVRSRKCVNYVGQLVWRGQPRWHRTNLLMTSAQERGGSTGKQGQDPPYKRVFNPLLHRQVDNGRATVPMYHGCSTFSPKKSVKAVKFLFWLFQKMNIWHLKNTQCTCLLLLILLNTLDPLNYLAENTLKASPSCDHHHSRMSQKCQIYYCAVSAW